MSHNKMPKVKNFLLDQGQSQENNQFHQEESQ